MGAKHARGAGVARTLRTCMTTASALDGGGMRRSPTNAKVKSKMMYASTKDFFKGCLEGIALELQATELSEIDEPELRARVEATLTRK